MADGVGGSGAPLPVSPVSALSPRLQRAMQVSLVEFTVTVMVAVPEPTAVTRPVLVTVTTAALEDT